MSRPSPSTKTPHSSFFATFEENVLSILLISMIVLACAQIFLRFFFSSGLVWVDPLLRYMVLWSGLLGAAMATSKGKHIALDLVDYLIPKRLHPLVTFITHLFSTIVTAFLTYAAYNFIKNELEFGGTSLLAIPSWIWNLIFPLAFGIITYRFFLASIASLRDIFSLPHSPKKQ